MNGDFSDEQYMFQESFRGFLGQYWSLAKHAALIEGEGFDSALWSKLAELGLFSILVPDEYGGMGLSLVDLSLVIEQLGRALVGSPAAETLIATDALARFGSPEQKTRWLPRIAAGEARATIAVLESEQGYEPRQLNTRAVGKAPRWTLNGRKILVPYAALADLILVVTRSDAGGAGAIVLLEASREGVGLRLQPTLDPAGRHYELALSGVELRAEDFLGGPAQRGTVDRLLDVCSAVAATQMIGIAGKVLDLCVAFASQRMQFGQPIGTFQAIQHKCADMAVAVDAGRSAAYYAAWAVAQQVAGSSKAASMAKAFCGDTARAACNEGIQIHGGIGFTWELGLHFYLRSAKLLEYQYGDAAFHRERVVAATLIELNTAAAAPALAPQY